MQNPTKLITLEDIQDYKGVTSSLNNVKQLDPFILEAQDFDLRPFLGEELYIALLEDFEAKPRLQDYGDLFNGSTYTYAGRTYKHEGIIPILVYYAHSRYLMFSNAHSTKYGMVQKTNDFSDPVSEKTMARLIQQAKSGALIYQERVKQFLDRNTELYPLWKGGHKRRKSGLRLTAIGGNNSRKNPYSCEKCCEEQCDCDVRYAR